MGDGNRVRVAYDMVQGYPQLLPSLAIRRRAGKAAAEAALAYMRDHAPVRTGKLRDSWEYDSAKGYNIEGSRIIVKIHNTAREYRRNDPEHHYMQYIELGFTHVPDMTWHEGQHDLEGAAFAARDAAVAVIRAEMAKAAKEASHPKRYITR